MLTLKRISVRSPRVGSTWNSENRSLLSRHVASMLLLAFSMLTRRPAGARGVRVRARGAGGRAGGGVCSTARSRQRGRACARGCGRRLRPLVSWRARRAPRCLVVRSAGSLARAPPRPPRPAPRPPCSPRATPSSRTFVVGRQHGVRVLAPVVDGRHDAKEVAHRVDFQRDVRGERGDFQRAAAAAAAVVVVAAAAAAVHVGQVIVSLVWAALHLVRIIW